VFASLYRIYLRLKLRPHHFHHTCISDFKSSISELPLRLLFMFMDTVYCSRTAQTVYDLKNFYTMFFPFAGLCIKRLLKIYV